MAATVAAMRISPEENQSASSPRSSMICSPAKPTAMRPIPIKSVVALPVAFFSQGGSSTRLNTAKVVRIPIGTLIKNTQRQVKLSVIQPPSVGPSTGATTVATTVTANALLRCSGLNVSRMMACWFGCKPPPKSPCRMRKMMSSVRFVAMPQRKEQMVNAMMQATK
jgi:hypothetical protein